MEKNFNEKELEILVDLVDEEIEETKTLEDEEKLKTLNHIKDELEKKEVLNADIRFGMELSKLQRQYYFKDLVKFVKGETNNCYNFDTLNKLFAEFGYEKTINAILTLGDEDE